MIYKNNRLEALKLTVVPIERDSETKIVTVSLVSVK